MQIEYCRAGWPRREGIDPTLQPYWKVRGSLTICDNLLLYNGRIVVPKELQREIMNKIHDGHQGIERSYLRAKASIRWPGITMQKVQSCQICSKEARSAREPLIITPLPQFPWQKVWTVLFELNKLSLDSGLFLSLSTSDEIDDLNLKCCYCKFKS